MLNVSGGVLPEKIALECNCKEFLHSGNDCAHTIAVLALHCNLKLSSVQDNVVARRRVGRPTTAKTNCLAKDKAKSPNHSTSEYLSIMQKKPIMHFHLWRVVRTFGGANFIGIITQVRPVGKNHLWGIRYPHHVPDDFEELTADELAQGLADAHKHDKSGPDPEKNNVLISAFLGAGRHQ